MTIMPAQVDDSPPQHQKITTQELLEIRPFHVLQEIPEHDNHQIQDGLEEPQDRDEPETSYIREETKTGAENLDETSGGEDPPEPDPHQEEDTEPLTPPEQQLDHDYPHVAYKDTFDGILSSPRSDDNWKDFEKILAEAIEDVRNLEKIKELEPRMSRMTNKKPKTDDTRFMQRLYKQNRRKAVRLIVDPNPSFCTIPKTEVFEHFSRLGQSQETDHHVFEDPPASRPKLPMRSFRHEEVERLLRKAENTAPGNDRIAYRDWLRVDPKCYVLSTIYNICLR